MKYVEGQMYALQQFFSTNFSSKELIEKFMAYILMKMS